MADKRDDQERQPKSSTELIQEALEGLRGGDADASEASGVLMDDARSWLETNDRTDSAPEPDPALIARAEAEAEIEMLFEPPARQPRPRRSRLPSTPVPPGPIGDGGQATRRPRLLLGMAAIVGVVVLAGNLIGLLTNDKDEPPVTVSLTGSISSASDPCSGADIGGNLEAVITYWRQSDDAQVDITITGNPLWGSDGTSYTLEIFGAGSGTPGQAQFEFPSQWMQMIRSDGLVIDDEAIITVDIADGVPDNWSYTSGGGTCSN